MAPCTEVPRALSEQAHTDTSEVYTSDLGGNDDYVCVQVKTNSLADSMFWTAEELIKMAIQNRTMIFVVLGR